MYLKRDIDQREIDLLYVDEDAIYPIEVKKAKHQINRQRTLTFYRNTIWR